MLAHAYRCLFLQVFLSNGATVPACAPTPPQTPFAVCRGNRFLVFYLRILPKAAISAGRRIAAVSRRDLRRSMVSEMSENTSYKGMA